MQRATWLSQVCLSVILLMVMGYNILLPPFLYDWILLKAALRGFLTSEGTATECEWLATSIEVQVTIVTDNPNYNAVAGWVDAIDRRLATIQKEIPDGKLGLVTHRGPANRVLTAYLDELGDQLLPDFWNEVSFAPPGALESFQRNVAQRSGVSVVPLTFIADDSLGVTLIPVLLESSTIFIIPSGSTSDEVGRWTADAVLRHMDVRSPWDYWRKRRGPALEKCIGGLKNRINNSVGLVRYPPGLMETADSEESLSVLLSRLEQMLAKSNGYDDLLTDSYKLNLAAGFSCLLVFGLARSYVPKRS